MNFIKCFDKAFLILLLMLSCQKDFNERLPTRKLKLSSNEINFYTTFTQLTSPTYQLKITNQENNDILIPSIRLEKEENSYYNLEVNGNKNKENIYHNILIRKNDFIILYLSITPRGNKPIQYEDNLLIKLPHTLQKVKLSSNIENAELLKSPSKGKPYKITTDTKWDSRKSRIIYDSLIVSSGAQLTIEKGTKIYFNSKGIITIEKKAKLIINGTKDEQINFRGYRTKPLYDTLAGTWEGITFEKNAAGKIDYAYITGAKTAIKATEAKLTLTNTQIYNSQQFGLFGENAAINASNLAIDQAGRYSVFLNKGGKYTFEQCTLVNYCPLSSKEEGALYISNVQNKSGQLTYSSLDATFANNILFSRDADGLTIFFDEEKAPVSILFDTNLINERSQEVDFTSSIFKGNILNKNPMLKHASTFSNHNLELMKNSPALDVGKLSIARKHPMDLLGRNRTVAPDLGAYEFTND